MVFYINDNGNQYCTYEYKLIFTCANVNIHKHKTHNCTTILYSQFFRTFCTKILDIMQSKNNIQKYIHNCSRHGFLHQRMNANGSDTNDLFSWNNKYNEYMAILLHYLLHNGFIANFPAMHDDLLCACWYLWAVKGSSSLSFCRLLISPRFTSCRLLCPKLTDAPYSGLGTRPLPLPKWRLHSQDPHTLPSQGTTQ